MCKYATLIFRILSTKILVYIPSFPVMNAVFISEHPLEYTVVCTDKNYSILYTLQQLKL